MTCTVVVPCYNEAARFQTNSFRSYLETTSFVRFVFVNDGSGDTTCSMLESLRSEFPNQIAVIDKKVNAGKGEAVRDGILYALNGSSDAVGFWDADLAAPLNAIADLLGPLKATPAIQMVFGSRVKLIGRDIERKPTRHYLGRVFATLVSTLLRLPIYDTQCGAKLFRANQDTRKLFENPFNSRWVFDVEILARFIQARHGNIDAIREGIYEFPLFAWRDVGGSKVRPKDFFRAFVDVIRIQRIYRIR